MPTDLSFSLSPEPSSGGVARAALRERYAGTLPRAALADLELVVSELVTNAVEHGRGAIQVEVERRRQEIRGVVSDHGSGFAYRACALDGVHIRGRGLAIVDALTTRWGIHPGSTKVWFAISLPGT